MGHQGALAHGDPDRDVDLSRGGTRPDLRSLLGIEVSASRSAKSLDAARSRNDQHPPGDARGGEVLWRARGERQGVAGGPGDEPMSTVHRTPPAIVGDPASPVGEVHVHPRAMVAPGPTRTWAMVPLEMQTTYTSGA